MICSKMLLFGVALILVDFSFCRAGEMQMHLPAGELHKRLGDSALKDPFGKTHLLRTPGKVVVSIFSVPDWSQGDQQKQWSKILATNLQTALSDRVAFLLVENMAMAGIFKGMALDSMKEKYRPRSRPLLLLDQSGSLFKKFEIPRDTTEILIFDRKGRLRDVEENLDRERETIERIRGITEELRQS